MRTFAEKLKALCSRGGGRHFLSVDFDSRHLRLVQGERLPDSVRIRRLIAVSIPDDLDITDAQGIGEFLGRTLREMKLKETGVLMNVPRGQAVLKPVTLPPGTTKAELAGMVGFQVERQLPFAPPEAIIDFTIETHYAPEDSPQTTPPGIEVLGAAVRLPVVDYYRQIALSAGLKLLRLGLRPYATARCVQQCVDTPEPPQSLAVVHVTCDEAEIHVLEGRALTFSRSILGKISSGAQGGAADSKDAVHAVVTEVVRSLQSYQYQGTQRGVKIEKVVLAGGTGIEPRLSDELTRRLGIECRMLDPAASLGLDYRDAGDASSFVSALGLATAHHRADELPFDFLNPKRPPVQRDKRKIRTAAIAAGVAVILLLSTISGAVYLFGKNAELRGLETKRNDLDKDTRGFASLEKRVKSIDAWIGSGYDGLEHLAYLSKLFPPKPEAYIDGVNTNSEARSISFTVYARRREVVDELGKRLSLAGYDFEPDKVSTTRDPRYVYTVKVKVTVPPDMQVDLSPEEQISPNDRSDGQ